MAKETFSSLIDLFKTSSHSTVSTLVCDVCGNKLSVFRRKKPCAECKRQFCSQCLQRCRDRALRCKNCYVLTMRPPLRSALLDLRVKDLQYYLHQHNVSTRGCLEKEDLVNVLLRYASTQAHAPNRNTGNFSAGNSSRHSEPSTTTPSPSSSSCTHLGAQPGTAAADAIVHSIHPVHPGPGDSDSSSDTSFEMVQRPSSDENISSVNSSASSSVSNRGNATPSVNSSIVSTTGLSATRSDEAAEMLDTAAVSPEVGSTGLYVALEPNMPGESDTATGPNVASTADTESLSVDGAVSGLASMDMSVQLDAERETSSSASTDYLSTTLGTSEMNSQSPLSQQNSACNSPNLLRGTMASVSSEADFEALSIKQLKDILHRHRVNYHGCCEKAELVDRAKRLYRDYCSSRADLEKLDLDALCKICMDAPVECVMLECGHMATCTDCGRQLSECPICRQFVVRIVRTFKA